MQAPEDDVEEEFWCSELLDDLLAVAHLVVDSRRESSSSFPAIVLSLSTGDVGRLGVASLSSEKADLGFDRNSTSLCNGPPVPLGFRPFSNLDVITISLEQTAGREH